MISSCFLLYKVLNYSFVACKPAKNSATRLFLAGEFGVMPCSAIDPQVDGDVIGVRVWTDKTQTRAKSGSMFTV